MKTRLLFIIVMIITMNSNCQVIPDSLIGMYTGSYYFKYDSDSNWTIKPDTTYVTFIDTNNCSDKLHGDIGIFNIDGFITNYSFCHGTISNQITFFYGIDSLYIKWDHISQPPPNYVLYSNRFIGKRISGTEWVGIQKGIENIEFKIFPNPALDKINIENSEEIKISLISIYDLQSKLILQQEILESKSEINVSNLIKGMYFIKIVSDKQSLVRKFLKE